MGEIIFFCSIPLLVYWIARTRLLLSGSEDEIEEVLHGDLWWGYRVLIAVRSLFSPSNQIAG